MSEHENENTENTADETRELPVLDMEVRSDGGVSGRAPVYTLRGTAVRWNELSNDLGGFRERHLPGSMSESIRNNPLDIRMLVDHDTSKVLGRVKAGTLTVSENKRGIDFSNTMPNTSYANDLAESIARGDISDMSFRFRKQKDSFGIEGGERIRSVEKSMLRELSVVTFPAFDGQQGQLSIEARQLDAAIEEIRSGAKISRASRAAIESAIATLTELLGQAEPARSRDPRLLHLEMRAREYGA